MKSTTHESKPKDYPLPDKDKAWVNSKLREYKALIGKSIDAETHFAAKEKEWVAALKLGRQSARDRFKAGKVLVAIQKKLVDEIGYPFWPWLKSMEVPHRTAERAIELAKFYKSEVRLGDKTITECYGEMKVAKAKVKAKVAKEHPEDADTAEENGDVKLEKDTDTVSVPLPNVTLDDNADDLDDLDPADDEQDDGFELNQSDLESNLVFIADDLHNLLQHKLGSFTDPENIVKQIDKCIDLLSELKAKTKGTK